MSQYSKISRRDFIKMAGLVAASGTLAACGVPATGPPVAATAPAVVKGGKVRIAVGGWAEQNLKDLLAVTEFTKNQVSMWRSYSGRIRKKPSCHVSPAPCKPGILRTTSLTSRMN